MARSAPVTGTLQGGTLGQGPMSPKSAGGEGFRARRIMTMFGAAPPDIEVRDGRDACALVVSYPWIERPQSRAIWIWATRMLDADNVPFHADEDEG